MPSKYLIVVLLLLVCFVDGQSEICSSMRIQNEGWNLNQLRDCRIITGNLLIVLMDRQNQSLSSYEFPKLEEIWEYLIVMRITKLYSIGKLFPNLRKIGGRKLFRNYALVLYDVRDLEEVGLTSLQRIERGNVRIQNCSNLCYHKTVNWKNFGTDLEEYDNGRGCKSECPEQCKVGCWSQYKCQQETSMDDICKKFLDDGKCVDKCAESKILLFASNYCITKEECLRVPKIKSRNWFVYNGTCTNKCPPRHEFRDNTCVFCDNDCKEICTTNSDDSTKILVVNSMSTAEALDECVYINGSLRITVEDNAVARELPNHLGQIKEIWGHLKIHRSSALTSLEFLKNLQLIRGDQLETNNSLIVVENQNLNKLWDWNNFTMKIAKGTIQFHYNPQLCLSEIETLNERTVQMELSPSLVSRDSNGDQVLCNEIHFDLEKSIINPTNVTLNWDRIRTAEQATYFVYYVETELLGETNMCLSGWSVVHTTEDTVDILKLKPFTNYSFYITISVADKKNQFRTQIYNFTTLSDDPSMPLNVIVFPHNSSALNFTWLPPKEPRGKLQKYVFSYKKLLDDVQALRSRNFCQHPLSRYDDEEETSTRAPLRPVTATLNDTCNCPNVKRETLQSFRVQTQYFEELFIDSYGTKSESNSKNYYVWHASDETVNEIDHKFIDELNKPVNKTETGYQEHIVGPDATETTIGGLDYFSTYIFYMTACNENRTERAQCSEVLMVFNRTLKKVEADKIVHFKLAFQKKGVVLNWTDPIRPNSALLSYTVEWKSTGVVHSTTRRCINWKDLSPGGYTLVLAPGDYKVRVRVNTLAGPGVFTTFQKFFVASPYGSNDKSLVIGIVCGCIAFVMIVAGVAYYIRKRRKQMYLDQFHLIRRINPEYMGMSYVVDEWEIDRQNLEIGNSELGKGTFGVVYSGTIKDTQLPCAIKTVNVNATHEEKMEFLNEASVMKAFNTAHHVVRLLGVVSQGQSPLVVMELMACGDLKSFLRRSRDSSKSIRCNEMFRMAAEIADGMAYLAAKKFVHRDLAARNCMVSGDSTVKIGDFGMARDIYETDYYRKETKGLLPVRWMAPESLADGVFSSDSDVWSYGVVLWEMVTLAEQPYQGLANEQVFQFVTSRGCLSRPSECPDLLYEIMEKCWKWRPMNRPLFIDIVQKLENHVGQGFRLVSFYHSREGEEYRLNIHERPNNVPALNLGANQPFALFHKSDENVDLYGTETNHSSQSSFPNQRHLLSDIMNDNTPDNDYSSYTHMTP